MFDWPQPIFTVLEYFLGTGFLFSQRTLYALVAVFGLATGFGITCFLALLAVCFLPPCIWSYLCGAMPIVRLFCILGRTVGFGIWRCSRLPYGGPRYTFIWFTA